MWSGCGGRRGGAARLAVRPARPRFPPFRFNALPLPPNEILFYPLRATARLEAAGRADASADSGRHFNTFSQASPVSSLTLSPPLTSSSLPPSFDLLLLLLLLVCDSPSITPIAARDGNHSIRPMSNNGKRVKFLPRPDDNTPSTTTNTLQREPEGPPSGGRRSRRIGRGAAKVGCSIQRARNAGGIRGDSAGPSCRGSGKWRAFRRTHSPHIP
jgi:hypothetical protein